MRRNFAFTLVEIMLVIVIVVILITVVAPGIMRSRVVGNETAAIGNLKIISNACQLYHINEGTYPAGLITLANASPSYIDAQLGAGTKQRYQFVYSFVDQDNFTLNANSLSTGLLQGKFFYTDQSGIIRAKVGAQAGPDDEIVK